MYLKDLKEWGLWVTCFVGFKSVGVMSYMNCWI